MLAACLAFAACTEAPPNLAGSPGSPVPTEPATTVPTTDPLPVVSLDVVASFGRLVVDAGDPGTTVTAVDSVTGDFLAEDLVEPDGSAVVTGLAPGTVQLVVELDGTPVADAGAVIVPGTEPPEQAHYDSQSLEQGFGYVEVRDGTLLSANVTFPPGRAVDDGPFPTLVEYSGYEPSDPDALDPARLTLPLLGYVLVQVNVRGTGCSGGAFDPFDGIERLDGYDIIETVASQPWSARVGMWGVSYPGIMQLHVAAADPPNLAAIAPLSVISSIEDTLFPGGIYNNGFGRSWSQRVTEAAAAGGRRWVSERIAAGDETCRTNQRLRQHNRNLVATVEEAPYTTQLSRSRSPESLVDDIDVPVFLAGAWQDEQTGGGFPSMIDELQAASPAFRAYLYNGLHIDPLGPEVLVPLLEFYDLHVAERSPVASGGVGLLFSAGTAAFFGTPLRLAEPELAGVPYAEALDRWLADPPIHVLYELGATAPNLPVAHFAAEFERWPPPSVAVERWFLRRGGGLQTAGPPTSDDSVGRFTTDPSEGALTTTAGPLTIWTARPDWNWPAAEATNRLSFRSDALEDILVLTGPASADLLVRLPGGEADADLEATLTDIDPDGFETFVQAGVLRLSRRALSEDATALRPRISNTAEDIDPVGAGEVVEARIEILPFAHVVRPGHRLGLTIDTPGATRPEWTYDVIPRPVEVEVLAGSSVALPVVERSAEGDIADLVPSETPACGALRGQPCRPADPTTGR